MRTIVASEHEEQKTLMQWAELEAHRHPDLRLLFAIPNGARTSWSVAKRLKAEGLKSGVPDLCLPVPVGQYHGLYIEMKRVGESPSAEQKQWISDLLDKGYFAIVCRGWQCASETVLAYLKGEL